MSWWHSIYPFGKGNACMQGWSMRLSYSYHTVCVKLIAKRLRKRSWVWFFLVIDRQVDKSPDASWLALGDPSVRLRLLPPINTCHTVEVRCQTFTPLLPNWTSSTLPRRNISLLYAGILWDSGETRSFMTKRYSLTESHCNHVSRIFWVHYLIRKRLT